MQNFLNESLKYIDKAYPSSNGHHHHHLAGLPTSSSSDSKPVHLDPKGAKSGGGLLSAAHSSQKKMSEAPT